MGYEHAFLASRIEPEKRLNQQLAQYILSQGDDFHDLNQIIALRCWAVVEAFVEDVCLVAVELVDWQHPHERLRKIKCDLHEILASSKEEVASFVLSKIADQVGSSLKQGVGRFESVLEVLELGGAINESVKNELFTLSKYRNCIMHSDSVIDVKLVECIPVLSSNLGARLGITHIEARRFLFACLWYVMEIQRRFATRLGDVVPAQFIEEQSRFLESMRECDTLDSRIPFAKPNLTFAKSVPIGSTVLVVGPAEGANDKSPAASKSTRI